MKHNIETRENNGERGAALVLALMMMALLLALTMGMSMTAVSELGVSNTYANQTKAFQAAEAGIYHGMTLIRNFDNHGDGGDPTFSKLLLKRLPVEDPSVASNSDPLVRKNPFTDPSFFVSGSVMVTDAVDAGGNTILNASGQPVGHQLVDANGNPVAGTYYSVHVIDDESAASTTLPVGVPKVPNFYPPVSPQWEDINGASDSNNRVVVYSTGTYGNTSVTIEGWIGFMPFPALSANNNVEISGNAQITGAYGGVHSNNNIVENGNGWWVEQTVTATGTLTGDYAGQVGGFYGGSQPPLDLPPFVTRDPLTSGGPDTEPRLQDFLIRRADTLLIDPDFADGAHETTENDAGSPATRQLRLLANRLNIDYALLAAQLDDTPGNGNNIQQSNPVAIRVSRTVSGDFNSAGIPTRLANTSDVGWTYSSGNWGIVAAASGASAAGHTVYAVGSNNYNSNSSNGGNILLNGNVGGNGAPIAVTMFSTGSIEVRGNVNITANLVDVPTSFLPPFVTPDILMMAVEDIWVNGDFAASISFTGVSYAGEAVKLSGSGSINGQMIAYNWPHIAGSPVGNLNIVTGNFQLTLNDGDSIGRIKLYSWRQIKK